MAGGAKYPSCLPLSGPSLAEPAKVGVFRCPAVDPQDFLAVIARQFSRCESSGGPSHRWGKGKQGPWRSSHVAEMARSTHASTPPLHRSGPVLHHGGKVRRIGALIGAPYFRVRNVGALKAARGSYDTSSPFDVAGPVVPFALRRSQTAWSAGAYLSQDGIPLILWELDLERVGERRALLPGALGTLHEVIDKALVDRSKAREALSTMGH